MLSPDEQKNQSFRSLLFGLVTDGLCYEQARQQGLLVVLVRMIVPARPVRPVVPARLVVPARPASGLD